MESQQTKNFLENVRNDIYILDLYPNVYCKNKSELIEIIKVTDSNLEYKDFEINNDDVKYKSRCNENSEWLENIIYYSTIKAFKQ